MYSLKMLLPNVCGVERRYISKRIRNRFFIMFEGCVGHLLIQTVGDHQNDTRSDYTRTTTTTATAGGGDNDAGLYLM